MVKHLDQFHLETAHLPYERCLGGDQHTPALTVAYQAKAAGGCCITAVDVCVCEYVFASALLIYFVIHVDKGTYLAYIPAELSDVIAPVDHNFGAYLKSDVHLLFQKEFEKNLDGLCNPLELGGLHAW